MPRKIKMSLSDDQEFYITLKKFSKADLYGVKSVEKRSENNLLNTVSISSDGVHILPKGSTTLQFLGEDGKYVEKSDIDIYSSDGEIIELTPSMFRTGVKLEEITFSDYFRYNFRTTYYLVIQNSDQHDLLYSRCMKSFENEKMLKFVYAYKDSPNPRDAVLIPKNNKIIAAVGKCSPQIYNSPVLNVDKFTEINDEEEELKFEDIW